MKVFNYGTVIALIILVVFMYSNPPRTATIKFANGTTTTASVPVIAGDITVNNTYPVFKDLFGAGYVIGTGNELVKIEYVKVINIKSDW